MNNDEKEEGALRMVVNRRNNAEKEGSAVRMVVNLKE